MKSDHYCGVAAFFPNSACQSGIRKAQTALGALLVATNTLFNGLVLRHRLPAYEASTTAIQSKQTTLLLKQIIAAIALAFSSVAMAHDTVPPGYVIQELDYSNAIVMMPKEWHYGVMSDKQSITWTVSKNKLRSGGNYDTGWRLQLFPRMDVFPNMDAKSVAKMLHDQIIGTASRVIREYEPRNGGGGGFLKQYIEIEEKGYREQFTIFWSERQNLVAYTVFSAPVAEWEQNRPFANTMARFDLTKLKIDKAQ